MGILVNNFRKNLRRHLRDSGLSQADLARRCKFSRGRITQILNHDDPITTDTMERIARALRISVYELLKR